MLTIEEYGKVLLDWAEKQTIEHLSKKDGTWYSGWLSESKIKEYGDKISVSVESGEYFYKYNN